MSQRLVPLPLTPTDFMLGGSWPRIHAEAIFYQIEDSQHVNYKPGITRLSNYAWKNSGRSTITVPIKIHETLKPDTALFNRIYLLTTNNTDTEEYDITVHTEESRQKFISEYKRYLCEDILTNGIPIIHLSPTISYTFQKKVYHFDVEVLKSLELARHPVQQQVVEVYNHTYAKHLAEYPILLPALCNGEFVLFRAQHKSATQLLQKYFDYHMKYLTEQNTMLDFIANYPFTKDKDFTMLWSTLFDTSNYYGETTRVKL